MSLLASEVLNSAKRRRQQELDERRMTFRRAIDDYAQAKKLSQELAEFEELTSADYWITAHAARRRSASPAR